MSFFFAYRAYLRDHLNGCWFKHRFYGRGWTPARWQGWAIVATCVLLVVANFLRIDVASHSVSDTLIQFVPQTGILAPVLVGICYYTGDRPRWSWGKQ